MSKKKTPQDAKYSSAKRIEIIENVLIFLSCIYSPFWDKLKYISDYNFIINILFIFLINLVAFLRQSYFLKLVTLVENFSLMILLIDNEQVLKLIIIMITMKLNMDSKEFLLIFTKIRCIPMRFQI